MKTASGFRFVAYMGLTLFGTVLLAQESAPSAATGVSEPVAAQDQTSAAPTSPVTSTNESIRILRVQVEGAAQLDRNTGRGFEDLLSNMPITEGNKLQTGDGAVEVQFEDASTLRIPPNSLVEFTHLERSETGAMASQVNLIKGTAYLHLTDNIVYGNNFVVTFGNEKLTLTPGSHVYVHVGTPAAKTRVVVFAGEVRAEGPSGTMAVDGKKTLAFNPGKGDSSDLGTPVVKKGTHTDEYDDWDKEAIKFENKYSNGSAAGVSPYRYGVADLNYYGTFIDDPGCGHIWQPYFASAAWDPYSNGAWVWYPRAGYTWVSAYPWGWLPYHYGSWQYCGAHGWGWQPGGQWTGLQNAPNVLKTITPLPPGSAPARPIPPPHPPLPKQPTILLTNSKPLPMSHIDSQGNLVIHKDSAGLGIPRGVMSERSIGRLSSGAIQHGSVSMPMPEHIGSTPGMGTINNGPAFNRVDAAGYRQGETGRIGTTNVSHGPAGGMSGEAGGGRMSAPASTSAPPSAPASSASGGSHK